MFDIHRLRREAHEGGKVFELTYYTDQGPRTLDAFMVRHREDDGFCFTIHDAATGQWLGVGDTKEDAESSARINLHQQFDFGIKLPPAPREG